MILIEYHSIYLIIFQVSIISKNIAKVVVLFCLPEISIVNLRYKLKLYFTLSTLVTKTHFIISKIIRPREIWRGPKCGLIVNMYTSLRQLNMFAQAKMPSLINVGSHGSQFSRFSLYVSFPLLISP